MKAKKRKPISSETRRTAKLERELKAIEAQIAKSCRGKSTRRSGEHRRNEFNDSFMQAC